MSKLFFGELNYHSTIFFFYATNAFAQKNTDTWEPEILKFEAPDKIIGQYKKIFNHFYM
jgi:hypothetical protein